MKVFLKITCSIIVLWLLLTSCFQENAINKYKIQVFENYLGSKEAQILNELVVDFELYLDSHYPAKSINEQYHLYLQEISNKNCRNIYQLTDAHFTYIQEKSQLLGHFIFPDSIIYLPESVFVSFHEGEAVSYIDIMPETAGGKKLLSRFEADSIQTHLKRETVKIGESTFYFSLKIVQPANELVEAYLLELGNEFTGMGINFIAPGLIGANADFNDYFLKRIVIIESIISEPGC